MYFVNRDRLTARDALRHPFLLTHFPHRRASIAHGCVVGGASGTNSEQNSRSPSPSPSHSTTPASGAKHLSSKSPPSAPAPAPASTTLPPATAANGNGMICFYLSTCSLVIIFNYLHMYRWRRFRPFDVIVFPTKIIYSCRLLSSSFSGSVF